VFLAGTDLVLRTCSGSVLIGCVVPPLCKCKPGDDRMCCTTTLQVQARKTISEVQRKTCIEDNFPNIDLHARFTCQFVGDEQS
jgi:hypothetical protein